MLLLHPFFTRFCAEGDSAAMKFVTNRCKIIMMGMIPLTCWVAHYLCDQTQVPLGGQCNVWCFTKQALLVDCFAVAVVKNCPKVKDCSSLFPKQTDGEWSKFAEETRKYRFPIRKGDDLLSPKQRRPPCGECCEYALCHCTKQPLGW